MERHPHILNAASNLLGICFLIITGLTLTKSNSRSLADEIAWFAAAMFLLSIGLSYYAIRTGRFEGAMADAADWTFILGGAALTGSTCVAVIALG